MIQRSNHQYTLPDGSASGLIPTAYATEIIEAAVESSVALSTFRRVNMPTGATHLPVLDVLPIATWVTGEPDSSAAGGEKTPTTMTWKGITLVAEEIAAIVPIHESVLEDMSINVWGQVRPRLAESIGVAVDAAVFAGTNKPASWPEAIIPAAVAAGNTLTATGDPVADYNALFGYVEEDGFVVDQVYAATSEIAALRGATANGVPIYVTEFRSDGRVNQVYGEPAMFDRSGYLGAAKAVAGDSDMAMIGIRTDLQYKLLDQATIDISSAQDGSAMLNLAQQDSVALRVRARFAFAVANPPTRLNDTDGYPFAVMT